MSEYYITVRQSSSMQPKHHARLLYLVQVLKNQIMYSNFPAVLCLSCLLWHFLCSLCRVPYNYCDAQTAFRYTTSSLPLGITWRSGGIFLGGRSRIRSERNTNETPMKHPFTHFFQMIWSHPIEISKFIFHGCCRFNRKISKIHFLAYWHDRWLGSPPSMSHENGHGTIPTTRQRCAFTVTFCANFIGRFRR